MLSGMRSLLIRLAVAVVYLSLPVVLGTLVWGLYLISEQTTLWLFATICGSWVIVGLGFAALLDKR